MWVGPATCLKPPDMRTSRALNAPPETPAAEFARVLCAEHRIEECLKRAKSEAGLADFEHYLDKYPDGRFASAAARFFPNR